MPNLFCGLPEGLFYAVSITLPSVLLGLWAFRGQLRRSLKTTLLFTALLEAAQALLILSLALLEARVFFLNDIFRALIYGIFMVLLVRAPLGKLLFLLLALSGFSNFHVVLGKHIENRLFGETASLERFHLTFTVCVIFVQAICLPVIYKVMLKPFAELEEEKKARKMWRYIWLVPATFSFLWMLLHYGMPTDAAERAIGSAYLVSKLIIDSGALLIYWLIIRLVRECDGNIRLMQMDSMQKIELAHYQALHEMVDLARSMRHDMRGHLSTIDGYAQKNGDMDVHRYVVELLDLGRLNDPLTYCQNVAANAVLQFYSVRAKKHGIRFEAEFNMPQDFFLEPVDVANLLGNLLQNAVDACVRDADITMPDACRVPGASNTAITSSAIKVKGRPRSDSTFVLSVENPSHTSPNIDESGRYLSHNHKGHGFGLESVSGIVKKYSGTMRIQTDGGRFAVSVVLYNTQI